METGRPHYGYKPEVEIAKSKDTNKRRKRQITEGEKIFATCVSNKELYIQNMYTFPQIGKNKVSNLTDKTGKELIQHFKTKKYPNN